MEQDEELAEARFVVALLDSKNTVRRAAEFVERIDDAPSMARLWFGKIRSHTFKRAIDGASR